MKNLPFVKFSLLDLANFTINDRFLISPSTLSQPTLLCIFKFFLLVLVKVPQNLLSIDLSVI